MKRVIVLLLTTIMTILWWAPAATASNPTVYLDGRQLYFDVPAQIISGRTMVPMRAIFEELGASVYWEDATRTVQGSKGSTVLKMTIGSTAYYLNNEPKECDVPVQIVSGRTLVPLRIVAESLQCKVDYNAGTNVVTIESGPNPAAIVQSSPTKPPVQQQNQTNQLEISKPSIIYPGNGTVVPKANVTLRWSQVAGAVEYAYGVRDMTKNTLIIPETRTTAHEAIIPESMLIEGHQYRAVAGALSLPGQTMANWGQYSFFTVQPPKTLSPPSIMLPANGATVSKADVDLRWTQVAGAVEYAYGLRDMTTNTLIIPETRTTDNEVLIPGSMLIEGHQYRAVAGALSQPGQTMANWGQYSFFSVQPPKTLSPPSILLPANGSTIPKADVTLKWSKVAGAVEYAYGLRDITTNTLIIPETRTTYNEVLIPGSMLIEGHQYRAVAGSLSQTGQASANWGQYSYFTVQ